MGFAAIVLFMAIMDPAAFGFTTEAEPSDALSSSIYELRLHNDRITLQQCEQKQVNLDPEAPPCLQRGCFCAIGSLLPRTCYQGTQTCCKPPPREVTGLPALQQASERMSHALKDCQSRLSSRRGTFVDVQAPETQKATENPKNGNIPIIVTKPVD